MFPSDSEYLQHGITNRWSPQTWTLEVCGEWKCEMMLLRLGGYMVYGKASMMAGAMERFWTELCELVVSGQQIWVPSVGHNRARASDCVCAVLNVG